MASGRYQQAEFAADLWQVHLGEGTDEYRDPVEFFRRTYLTASLQQLLVGAVRRLAGAEQGGDPVVQLQTNFGGGKTHSMLALYHLFGGTSPTELVGIDAVLKEALGTPGSPTSSRWNSPWPCAGAASSVDTFPPPPDWPKIMTLPGSPAEAAMLSFTHCSAATRSAIPM